MNPIQKRLYKRRAKLFYILAYAFIFLFAVEIITVLIVAVKEIDFKLYTETPMGLALLMLFAPLICTMTFAVIASFNANQRYRYKDKIKQYREYVFFQKCLSALLNKEFDDAVHYFNCMSKGSLRDFLWSFGICSFFQSTEEKWKTRGLEYITAYRNEFMPSNVTF